MSIARQAPEHTPGGATPTGAHHGTWDTRRGAGHHKGTISTCHGSRIEKPPDGSEPPVDGPAGRERGMAAAWVLLVFEDPDLFHVTAVMVLKTVTPC